MDPKAFVRVSVEALGLRIPVASKAFLGVQTVSSSYLSEIRLHGFPPQTASVPLLSPYAGSYELNNIAATFYLEDSDVRRLLNPSCFNNFQACLEVAVFTGRQGSTCGVSSGRQIGSFKLFVSHEWSEGKILQLFNGWTSIGKSKGPGAELHVRVRIEPDPRYVFEFEDETALSPQIVQLHGTVRQPIFSCKFSQTRIAVNSGIGREWLQTGYTDKERRERKGWKVTIHDLSGAAVALASMVTPFVPSAGSDCVSRSNPGAWLILRADALGLDTWQPWGRLEAWRERSGKGFIGCRFKLCEEGGGLAGAPNASAFSEILLSAQKGGEFLIDTAKLERSTYPLPNSNGNGDLAFQYGPQCLRGFVMNCRVQGEGKRSKPLVHLARRYITCIEDAAIFMALSAAVDLSIEACRPFGKKLRRGIQT